MTMSCRFLLPVLSLVLGMACGAAQAQVEFPSRPIRIVVAYPPGGVSDVVARALAEQLALRLGTSVLVENRAGASGTLAVNAVAKSAADGYTLSGEPRPHPHRRRAAAASSMDTTPQDYARFVAGFLRGDSLSPASRAAMTTPQGAITTATEFPTFQIELPAERQRPCRRPGVPRRRR